MLAFLALLGAPYIYDISSLRVKDSNSHNHSELYLYSNTYKEMQISTKQSAGCNKYHT